MQERYPFLADCVFPLLALYLATLHVFVTPEVSAAMKHASERMKPEASGAAGLSETSAGTASAPDPRDTPLRVYFPGDAPADRAVLEVVRVDGSLAYRLSGGVPLSKPELVDAFKALAAERPNAPVQLRTSVKTIQKGDLAEVQSLGEDAGVHVFIVAGQP